jgi:hypothetical protein
MLSSGVSTLSNRKQILDNMGMYIIRYTILKYIGAKHKLNPPYGEKEGCRGGQYDKEADFKSNISLHLRVSYYYNLSYSFLQ